jgi:hypothetical protein
VAEIAARHPAIALSLHPAAGESPALIAAMAEHALSLATT